MIARLTALAFTALATFALSFTSPAPGAGEHVDTRLGIKLSYPKTWAAIPLSLDERWMVAKFLSDKSYFHTEKGGGWTSEHKPDMQIIAFVSEAMKEKVKVDKKETEAGVTEIRIFVENPYKDYKDFLKGRYSGGGWYVSDEKEVKVGDIAATRYEIKVEKLSQDGPKRIFTYVYHIPDVDVAVQFEVLESAVDKLENELKRCFASFKTTPRKGGPLHEVSTSGTDFWSQLDLDKLSTEERKLRRQSMEQKSQDKATKTAPAGWKLQKIGRFLVMNHADEKFAKSIVDQCEAVWSWLDKTFPFVGDKEYVRAPILRICANQDEYNSFYKGGNYFSANDLEITTYQDYEGKTSYQLERINRAVKDIWLRDRDRDLQLSMPGWLSVGIDHFVGHIHVAKNGQAEFGKDYWNQDEVRERLREGKLTAPREVLMLGDEEFRDFGRKQDSAQLFGYFVTGAAAKNKKTGS
ncbi:MAG: hypothetical protein IPJ77_16060 [Planctomycetes bacterium]|nr:hypothetical protein [Planctomycetota bacterium]